MIPTIEIILDEVRTGTMSIDVALGYLEQHIELAADRGFDREQMRDHYAAMVLPSLVERTGYRNREYLAYAEDAYGYADAMLKARKL